MEVERGHITSQYFWNLIMKMTPQPKSIIQNVVHFGQFGQNLSSILGQFHLNLIIIFSEFHWKIAQFWLEFGWDFIDFELIYYQFSVIFSQFQSRGSTGISGFWLIFMNFLSILSRKWWKIADFLSKMGYFVDFLSILINFWLFLSYFQVFSLNFSWFSLNFNKGVVQDLGSISGQL